MFSLESGSEPVPGYRLLKFLGKGQFGEVWLAEGHGRKRVALKFIQVHGASGFKEFKAISWIKEIQHPNLLPITAAWLVNQSGKVMDNSLLERPSQLEHSSYRNRPTMLIVAMVVGDKSLAQVHRHYVQGGESGIPVEELLTYMDDAARGLDFLSSRRHDVGEGKLVAVQHRDVKPENILLVGDVAVICDFGVARTMDATAMTATGMIGSPAFMAPECIEGKQTSLTTDQYSLALTYYFLRTGAMPFPENATPITALNCHMMGKLDLSQVPDDEREVLTRATSVNPRSRYATCREMVKLLRSVRCDTASASRQETKAADGSTEATSTECEIERGVPPSPSEERKPFNLGTLGASAAEIETLSVRPDRQQEDDRPPNPDCKAVQAKTRVEETRQTQAEQAANAFLYNPQAFLMAPRQSARLISAPLVLVTTLTLAGVACCSLLGRSESSRVLERIASIMPASKDVDPARASQTFQPEIAEVSDRAWADAFQSVDANASEAPSKSEQHLLETLKDQMRHDRFEEAAELSRDLLSAGCESDRFYAFAVYAALVTNDHDNLREYYRRAVENGMLDEMALDERQLATYRSLWETESALRAREMEADDLPRVRMETTQGEIVLELFENEAPETVGNFIHLVQQGFYNGLSFHRVLPGFVAQSGCPRGDGTGGPGYTIYCESVAPNHRKHFRGSLSMAKSLRPDSGGSQFFLCFVPMEHLDGEFTVFGRTMSGMHVLAKLQRVDPEAPDQPEPDRIVKMEVIRKRDHRYVPNKVNSVNQSSYQRRARSGA